MLPAIASGDAGKVLAVNSNEDGSEWVAERQIVPIPDIATLIDILPTLKVGDMLIGSLAYSGNLGENHMFLSVRNVYRVDGEVINVVLIGHGTVVPTANSQYVSSGYHIYTLATNTWRVRYLSGTSDLIFDHVLSTQNDATGTMCVIKYR